MKNLSCIILIIMPLLGQAQSASKIEWKSWLDLEQSIKKEPKPIFIFFYTNWCSYCKKIKREIFIEPEVIAKLNSQYYAVEMNVEQTDTITFEGRKFTNKQALTKRNGIHELALLLASRKSFPFSLPTTIILNKDFMLKKRSFEYYTSKQLLNFLN